MKYVATVEANIWDSSNEAQTDKIIDWLTINAPNMFDTSHGEDGIELRVQTESGPRFVQDGEAIIINQARTFPEVMNGRAFKAIYDLMEEDI